MISQNNMRTITKNYSFSKQYLKEYINYSNYLDTLDIKLETKEWRLKHIRGFIKSIENKKITFSKLKAINVYEYMNSISKQRPKTRENRAICIRLFLNYLYENKRIKLNGQFILDKIRCTKDSNIPSTYTNKEIKKILSKVDIKSNLGKRDYAILLLFANLGLRLKDVKCFTLKNINWLDNKIIITQHKDNEVNVFPLTEDIRYAILDYLKNERPKSPLEEIFLTQKGTIISSSGIYNIVDKYFKKANIEILNKKHGPHSFRHSLATSLLEDKIGIKDIADILGHDDITSTKVYTKVNIEELKKLSLEVPTWKI